MTVNPGSEGTVAVRASFPVGSGSVRGYKVTFSSPLCPDTGCDVSNCVNIAVFQGLVAGSGNPHSSAAVLYVIPDPTDVASVDVYGTGANVTSFVFSLEALCVNALQ